MERAKLAFHNIRASTTKSKLLQELKRTNNMAPRSSFGKFERFFTSLSPTQRKKVTKDLVSQYTPEGIRLFTPPRRNRHRPVL